MAVDQHDQAIPADNDSNSTPGLVDDLGVPNYMKLTQSKSEAVKMLFEDVANAEAIALAIDKVKPGARIPVDTLRRMIALITQIAVLIDVSLPPLWYNSTAC